ncbi:MAG: formate dehydrogenase accessory sulfurtransferase FdhD [Planctomycetota bacterium]
MPNPLEELPLPPIPTQPAAGAVAGAAIIKARVGANDTQVTDPVAVEAPLELRFGPRLSTVLMRTPGHDEDLAYGFLFTEGVITEPAEVLNLRRPIGGKREHAGNVIEAELDERTRPRPAALDRIFYGSSSCGVCGKNSLAALEVTAPPIAGEFEVSRAVLHSLPAKLRAAQLAFAATGGLHASGLFDANGTLLAVREDVGRHNALDKVIGWALRARQIPLAKRVLVVSGRASYELLQKSIVAGIPVLAAVGAPSSLAVSLAERFGVTLAGFVTNGTMNVYAHGERLRP